MVGFKLDDGPVCGFEESVFKVRARGRSFECCWGGCEFLTLFSFFWNVRDWLEGV